MLTLNSSNAANGNWSEWGPWEQLCSIVYQKLATRRRYCTNPSPRMGGDPCPGNKSVDFDHVVCQSLGESIGKSHHLFHFV